MLNQTQTQTTDEPDGGIDILDDAVRLAWERWDRRVANG